MAGSEAYRRKRTYPTLKEALEDPDFTLVPKFDNPVDMVLAKIGEMDKSILAHRAFEELDDADKLHWMPGGGIGTRPPEGMEWINDKIFQANGPRYGAVGLPPDAINAGLEPEEVRVFGRRIMGAWAAPKPLADIVNNHLSPGIGSAPLLKLWRGINNTLNLLQLSLSYYHGLTTTLNSSFSDIALGLQQLVEGHRVVVPSPPPAKKGRKQPPPQTSKTTDFRGAAANIGRGLVPFASVIQDMFVGTKIQYAWDHWDAGKGQGKIAVKTPQGTAYVDDPVTWSIIDAMKAGGGASRQDAYYAVKYSERVMEGVRTLLHGEFKDSALALVKTGANLPFAGLEQAMRPIMEYMVPRAKLSAFAKLMEVELNLYPDMSRVKLRDAAGRIWDSIDNRFGQLRQKNMMLHAVTRELINGTVGRFGWSIGSVREIGMGGTWDLGENLVDLGKNVRDVAAGGAGDRPVRLSKRSYYVLGMILGTLLIDTILQYLMTAAAADDIRRGELPASLVDLIDPRTGGVTETGHPSRIIMPSYLAKDVQSYTTHFWRTVGAKMAQPLSMAIDLFFNRDYYNHKIYGPGGVGLKSFLVDHLTPYSITGAKTNYERGESALKTVLPMVGIMPAGTRVGLSRAERMVVEYQDEQRGGVRTAPSDTSRAASKVLLEAKRGKTDEAREVGRQAVGAGAMTRKDVVTQIQRARENPFLAGYKRIGTTTPYGLDTAMAIYDAATPEEKKLIYRDARQKAWATAQNHPYAYPSQATRQIASRNFGVKFPSYSALPRATALGIPTPIQ